MTNNPIQDTHKGLNDFDKTVLLDPQLREALKSSEDYLTIKEREWLHGLQREPHDSVQEGAQDGMVLHQRVVDVPLLQRQLHYGDRSFHGQPGILRVQDGHLHFIPADVCLGVWRRENCVQNWRNNSSQTS